MSIYQTYDANLPNYETPENELGGPGLTSRDVDKAVVGETTAGNLYDYDILSRPTVSGTGIQIPANLDNGIPRTMTNVGTEDDPVYQLDAAVLGDSSASLGTQIDTVNNGRMGDINVINTKFTGIEGDIVIHKDNKVNSIKGIVEDTALNDIFFSEMNVGAIQKNIRYEVNKITDQVVSNQSDNTLFIIMRSILLQYGNFRVSSDNLLEELRSLNRRVVEYASNNVSSNVLQYLGYIKDLEKLPTPMDRPVYHNKQNYTYDISNLL